MKSVFIYGVLYHGVRIFTGASALVYMMSQGLTIANVGFIKTFQAAIMLLWDLPLGYFSNKISRKLSVLLAAVTALI
ncbi:hypothetical protein [Bartonella rattaustraliani]|uniref:hypothetical protein n=1 Tax=Bartonella rattaustraliani TaxID=481139 RepID=UPI0002E526D2|nr:hypothetical protein [Bartonella rattaustraliani]